MWDIHLEFQPTRGEGLEPSASQQNFSCKQIKQNEEKKENKAKFENYQAYLTNPNYMDFDPL